jgi:hypothetical protein
MAVGIVNKEIDPFSSFSSLSHLTHSTNLKKRLLSSTPYYASMSLADFQE